MLPAAELAGTCSTLCRPLCPRLEETHRSTCRPPPHPANQPPGSGRAGVHATERSAAQALPGVHPPCCSRRAPAPHTCPFSGAVPRPRLTPNPALPCSLVPTISSAARSPCCLLSPPLVSSAPSAAAASPPPAFVPLPRRPQCSPLRFLSFPISAFPRACRSQPTAHPKPIKPDAKGLAQNKDLSVNHITQGTRTPYLMSPRLKT